MRLSLNRSHRWVFVCGFVLASAGAALAGPDVCGGGNVLAIGTATSGTPAACVVARRTLLVESLYYQNASKVGGTALAAYPLLRLRAGVAQRFELVVDAPSQVAESGLGGDGLYPASSPGIGLNYALSGTFHRAMTVGAELLPPESLYEPSRTAQPAYRLHFSSAYRVSHRLTLDAVLAGESSRHVGFRQICPTAVLGADLTPNERTRISFDVGGRIITRRSAWQSFGDLSVARLLRKDVAFAIGLGSAFNPVNDQKSHYLAAGFNFKP